MRPTPTSSSLLELRMGPRDERTWVIDVAGELDFITSAAFLGAAQAVPPEFAVEIEAGRLTFSDSAGMRAIVTFAASREVRPVTLRDPCRTLARLIGLVDTSGVLQIATRDRVGRETDPLAAYGAVLQHRSARLRRNSQALRATSRQLRRFR